MPQSRPLTLLFADVSGSTKLFEQRGDVVARQLIAQILAALAFGHLAETFKLRVEQPKQVVECLLVSAVRCGGEQH